MKQQFTIQAVTDCTIKFVGTIEYSIDNGNTWSILKKLSLPSGHEAQFRNAQCKSWESFYIRGTFNAYGCLSTLAPHGSKVFNGLFRDSGIINAGNLVLDFEELWESCYEEMFRGCVRLTTAPELPATKLADYCYESMFSGCISLDVATQLPATTLAEGCYSYMFKGCRSLTIAPELPATTLVQGCYYNMFAGCTGLKTAPELPAVTLANGCYYNMFQGCTGLTTAPVLHVKIT